MVIKRAIQPQIQNKMFGGKAIIIYGARQVGKTTLIKEIQKEYLNESIYFNCDEPDIRDSFTDVTSTELKIVIGDKKIVFIDEAQRVRNIGLTLKLLVDNYPQIQVVATGSSSFDLSNKIVEPLTGRKYEFLLYPFSSEEIRTMYTELEMNRLLERRILFGMYPDIVLNEAGAETTIKEITKSYLYKDLLQFEQIKNPEILEKLLEALALQIGNLVSYNELSSLVGINKKTVARYIDLLEKAFVIFRVKPYSRNLRKELTKLRKIYFFDTGIRNALINNFNELQLRQDVGNLWENFLISERVKLNNNQGIDANIYFWRTHQKQEIDYLEEKQGKLSAFELKWSSKKITRPTTFLQAYPQSLFELISRENYQRFVLK